MEKNSGSSEPSIWVLTAGVAGRDNQSIGVAQKLGSNIRLLDIRQIGGLSLKPFLDQEAERNKGVGRWPDIVVSCGMQTDETALRLKRMARDKIFNVKLGSMTSSEAYSDFDLICRSESPASMYIPERFRDKVIFTTGVAHKLTPETLEEGKRIWANQFSQLPSPRIAVLIGGNVNPERKFTPAMARKMGQEVNAWAQKTGASLLITTSRRTSQEAAEAFNEAITVPSYFHKWDAQSANPYHGLIGVADGIIVGGDSRSMVCDSCFTGKPVYFYPLPQIEQEEHWHLQNQLQKAEQLRKLGDSFEQWSYPPLDTAGDIAKEVETRMRKKHRSMEWS